MAQLTTTDGRCIEGIWVPIEIWDADISPVEKILFIEIHSYTVDGKEIAMSNAQVSNYLGVTEKWGATILARLAKRNLIDIRFDGKNRWVKTRVVAGKNELKQVVGWNKSSTIEQKFYPAQNNTSTLTPRVEQKFYADSNNTSTLNPEPNPPHTPPITTVTSTVNNIHVEKKEKENNIKEKEKGFDFEKAYRDLFTDAYNSTQWRELQERNHKGIDWGKAYSKFKDHIISQGRMNEVATMNVSKFMGWFSNAAPYFLTGCGTIELGPDEEITPDGKRRCRYAGCWNPIPLDAPPRPEGQYVWDSINQKWKHSDDVAYARKNKNHV